MLLNLAAGAYLAIMALLGLTTSQSSPVASNPSTEIFAAIMPAVLANNISTQTSLPAVIGTVSSIQGTTLSVSGKKGPKAPVTAYSVNASSAKVVIQNKTNAAPSASSLSAIKIGNEVTVVGTITGNSMTAGAIIIDLTPAVVSAAS